jgi:hypothetical protein
MAGDNSKRDGIGPVDRCWMDLKSVYRGEAGSEGGAISSNRQICEQ